jgi:two-component system, cell cycle sensor histidine kinase and response regulator CckA
MVRVDGSKIWVKTTTQQLPDGHLLFWLRDLTERHRLENQVREVQKLETAGLLAAGLAHDLNNLLMVVTGHAELLRAAQPDDSALRSVECIATATDRAAELTRKLLAFGRKQVMRPRPVDLNELVRKNRELIRSMAGERIELKVELSPELDVVEVDPMQVEQALWNLVTNACQAMQIGGCLTVRTYNLTLEADARDSIPRPRPDARFVALTVDDTGPGIREDTQRRLFDPFFTTKQAGSGLGLSVVHGVVGQSGGFVRVHNRVGRGAAFELCFPRSTLRVASELAAPPREPKASTGGTLLLVEDDPQVQSWLGQGLSRRGFRVVGAGDGEEALRAAGDLDEAPLAVISDVSLPRMSGPEVILRLRKRWPMLPVVFITGYARDDAFRALPVGSELLIKPFTLAALLERVERAATPNREQPHSQL